MPTLASGDEAVEVGVKSSLLQQESGKHLTPDQQSCRIESRLGL